MRLDISMQELYPVPIERVWHALTDPRMIERWLMRPDGYEAKVGARFALGEPPRAGCRGHVECEVLELSPPRRMVWSWRGADDPETTRLVMQHGLWCLGCRWAPMAALFASGAMSMGWMVLCPC